MNELQSEIKKQSRIWDSILKEFNTSCKEIQIEAYHMVNKWLLSNRITREKNENNNKPSTRQLDFAHGLNIENPESYTKRELSKKITEILGR